MRPRWADEEAKVQACELSGSRSRRVGGRHRIVLNPTHGGSGFFPIESVQSSWPGFTVEVAGRKGDNRGSTDPGCLDCRDTHKCLGCLAAVL